MASRKSKDNFYELACEQFAALGVDVEEAKAKALAIPVSLQCWQGDDVAGFEHLDDPQSLGGGIAVTGNYPGRARNPSELRADIEKVFSLVPGTHRLNLHACYAEFGGKPVDRDAITKKHFANWIAWAKENGVGLDFNPTYFAHKYAADGATLSHRDPAIRDFWVEHGIRCREIAAAFATELKTGSLVNFWMPDGSKDTPADRLSPRVRMAESLDRIFAKKYPASKVVDSLESKLFGVGLESYTVGSNEFFMGYAATRGKFICLDTGHFHPTEKVSDKLTAVSQFVPGIALHISRPVRWDSDHVVCLDDETRSIASELVWNDLLPVTRIGLDYFDASVNRIAAWTIGARNFRKALLIALLTPAHLLRASEQEADFSARLAWQEDFRMLPFGAVWNRLCDENSVPRDIEWYSEVCDYEESVLADR